MMTVVVSNIKVTKFLFALRYTSLSFFSSPLPSFSFEQLLPLTRNKEDNKFQAENYLVLRCEETL